jgi:hypothetical protein
MTSDYNFHLYFLNRMVLKILVIFVMNEFKEGLEFINIFLHNDTL